MFHKLDSNGLPLARIKAVCSGFVNLTKRSGEALKLYRKAIGKRPFEV